MKRAIAIIVIQLLVVSISAQENRAYQNRSWAELPAVISHKQNCHYQTHYAEDGKGTVRRNYTYCFDKSLHASYWVAYPLHECYDGELERKDPFGYDTAVESRHQANLKSSYTGFYDRGHQIPFADRKCSREMADQTYYATNMTPQNGNFNRRAWQAVERRVRKYVCSDTLYVVTGAHFGEEHHPSINPTTTDRSGKITPVPTHYYKVLLRTRSGNTGKSVAECQRNELQCVGILYQHTDNTATKVTKANLCSVAEIEKLTGFTLFTNVPNAPKNEFSPSDWGFQ